MDRDETTPTLLDKATEADIPSGIEDIAAGVILEKLERLRKIEELLRSYEFCCEHCDSKLIGQIGETVGLV